MGQTLDTVEHQFARLKALYKAKHGEDPTVGSQWIARFLSLQCDQGTCRSCGASVFWLKSDATGKITIWNPDGVSHFATCPNASQHRTQTSTNTE